MFALAFLLLCSAAQADLYRWVDPESGSIKFSNSPPPWYETPNGPKVERVPYAPPAPKPAAEIPVTAPGRAPTTPAAALPPRPPERK